jgi:hypothetical protein
MSRIVHLHGVPKKIVSDRRTQFTSKFCERLPEAMDTQLHFSSAYHPQTDSQTRRVNQNLEDVIRGYALQYEEVGIRLCCMSSSPITIVIKRV